MPDFGGMGGMPGMGDDEEEDEDEGAATTNDSGETTATAEPAQST